MAPLPSPADCDTCAEHQATKLLIKQHEDRLHDLEEHYMDISNDNSNLEGRVTMFIWIVGLSALLVCSIAFYGILQLDKFKAVYMADTRASMDVINELTTSVRTTQYSMSEVQKHIGEVQKEVSDIRVDIVDLHKKDD